MTDAATVYGVLLRTSGIPASMHDGVVQYLVQGLHPGHFLGAVLSNDLIEAVRRADAPNAAVLAAYVRFLYQHAPAEAWGTPERVEHWIKAAAGRRRS